MIKEFALASVLVFSAPTESAKPRPPKAEFKPKAEVTVGIFQESYVTVTGLEGRLIVQPEILAEFKLQSGAEISQEVMYEILERNTKLK